MILNDGSVLIFLYDHLTTLDMYAIQNFETKHGDNNMIF